MMQMRKVAVIDYGMGNLKSVLRAWQHEGADARLVDAPSQIAKDDIVVFPGQGAIADAMKLLKRTEFDKAIRDLIGEGRPFFGICLGLQALFEFSEEDGGVDCLGVFKGRVEKLRLPRQFKVPHMGWDNVAFLREKNPDILDGIENGDQFYFVHSYCVKCAQSDIVFGTTEYGGETFTSAVSFGGNLVATQFHPEKSQAKGLRLYSNFLKKAK